MNSFRCTHRWKFGLFGSECTKCGTRHLPPQDVCVECRASRQMKDVPFADGEAVVKTFAVDRLAFTPQPPMVAAILDFEGGGRVQSELTDVEPAKVAIGDPVEMTFRRLFTADGIHNYAMRRLSCGLPCGQAACSAVPFPSSATGTTYAATRRMGPARRDTEPGAPAVAVPAPQAVP